MEIPFPSESFIEDFVFNECILYSCCPIDQDEVTYVYRQVDLSPYGIADIIKVLIDYEAKEVFITVLELKNTPLKERDLSQLSRYVKAIMQQKGRYLKRSDFTVYVRGELAGLEPSGDFIFLLDHIKYLSAFTLSVDTDRGFTAKKIPKGWFKRGETYRKVKPIARDIFGYIQEMDSVEKIKESQNG